VASLFGRTWLLLCHTGYDRDLRVLTHRNEVAQFHHVDRECCLRAPLSPTANTPLPSEFRL
jgi:hypothetical protein